jgi:hypothetical protein
MLRHVALLEQTFFRNVGSYKSRTAEHPRRRHPSIFCIDFLRLHKNILEFKTIVDRVCGLVITVPGYMTTDPLVQGSIPSAARLSE